MSYQILFKFILTLVILLTSPSLLALADCTSAVNLVQDYYQALNKGNSSSAIAKWKAPSASLPTVLATTVREKDFFRLNQVNLVNCYLEVAEVFIEVDAKKKTENVEIWEGIIRLEKVSGQWKIAKMLLKRVESLTSSPPTPLSVASSSKEVYGIVTSEFSPLNIRQGMGEDTAIIAKVAKGSKLRILETLGPWYKVKLDNGTVGYASSDYITISTASVNEKESPSSSEEFRILLQQDFQQDNLEKRIIIQTKPLGDCHACGAIIKGSVLTKQNQTWQVESTSEKIAEVGSYGNPPEAKFVQIGKGKYGILFEDTFVNTGQAQTSFFLVTAVDKKIKTVFSTNNAGENNGGSCDNDLSEMPKCYSYEAKLSFVPKNNSDYFDIQVVTTGTRANEGDIISAVNTVQLFSFVGEQYKVSETPATLSLPDTTLSGSNNCVIGKPCGNTCISVDKECHIGETPPSYSSGTVNVRGYHRKDGTYVQPHTRRSRSK